MPTIDQLQLLRQFVLDRPLSQVGDDTLQTKVKTPFRAHGMTFTPSSEMSVRVLNRAEDKDGDAVFGADAHISFDLQSAWVKYKLTAKAAGELPLGAATLGASSEVELCDYRIHAAGDGAWDAMQSDLASPRSLLALDDVRALKPGEALSMDAGGALSASVSFSWSDALSSKLGEITRGLAGVPIVVKMRTGLDVTAQVKVKDHFSIVISRTRDEKFRIAVKKAKSRDHSFGIDVSFGPEITAVPAVDDALDALMESLAAEGEAEEAAASSLRSELRARLVKIAKWKASTGFAYEYARIDESTAIADFILEDESRLAGDHALAISGDFAKLADALRREPAARTLVRYLNQSELTRKSSTGFTLGPITAKDTSVFQLTTRTSLDGFRLISARGTRKYDENLLSRNDFEWTVDLKAQMTEFRSAPVSSDFDYGLHLSMLLERDELREADFDRMTDLAQMAPPEALLAEVIGKKGSIRVQLLLERDALIAAIGQVGDSLDAWAEPLAFAMRNDVYVPSFHAWLANEPLPRIEGAAGILEARRLPGSFAWTVGDGHPQLRERLTSFVRGARQLHEAMTTAQPPEAIAEAYESLQEFWSQRLYIVACMRYLRDRAPDAKVTLQIEAEDETITTG
jgi:hypothetical protein